MTRAPLLGALLYAGVVALVHYQEYRRLISAHAWTGATVTIGLGVVLGALAAVIGWFLGRAVLDLAAPSGDRKRPAIIVASILLFSAYMAVSVTLNRSREARLQAVREETLTPARIDALLKGSPEEKRALAWNRSCPPELLRELSLDPDYGVRANVASHPSTPAEVAAKLSLDPNETVRLYAGFHPSRYKAPVRP
jgi:hypothetical protein